MQTGRHGNQLATSSAATRDLYVGAVDKLLGAAPDMREAFEAVTVSDPGFALGQSGLARADEKSTGWPQQADSVDHPGGLDQAGDGDVAYGIFQ